MREVNHAQGQQLASARAHMEAQAIAQGEQLASVRAHMESQAMAAAAQQQQVGFRLMYLTLCPA
jgi:hypothetical protein